MMIFLEWFRMSWLLTMITLFLFIMKINPTKRLASSYTQSLLWHLIKNERLHSILEKHFMIYFPFQFENASQEEGSCWRKANHHWSSWNQFEMWNRWSSQCWKINLFQRSHQDPNSCGWKLPVLYHRSQWK